MNLNARRDRLFLCSLALLVAPIALWSSEALVKIDSMLPVPAGKDANDPNRFSVSGVVFMTGTPVALVTDTALSMSWFAWGKRPVDRYNVREITREQVVLVERGGGRELRLPVAEAVPGKPAPFTKEWIHSPANPMFGHIVSPPDELYKDWPNATNADKKEIADFYEKYGWKLVRAEIVAGVADFVWEWLYEADRIAAAQAVRENFLGLLAPAQRQAWEQIQSNPTIYAVNGKYTPEQEQASAERQRVFQQFFSTFTPEQKAAFGAMSRQGSRAPKRPDAKETEFSLARLFRADVTTATSPAPYTKAWINSQRNPMLDRCQSFPPELCSRWAMLPAADRLQVVEYYQKHGWQLLSLETVSGNTSSFSWQNIYGKERSAVLQAKREAFFNLLSPEQRQAWKTAPFNQTIYIKDGSPDYARNRNGSEQQRLFDPFWASLDARQRAAYEDMHDFTRADWN